MISGVLFDKVIAAGEEKLVDAVVLFIGIIPLLLASVAHEAILKALPEAPSLSYMPRHNTTCRNGNVAQTNVKFAGAEKL